MQEDYVVRPLMINEFNQLNNIWPYEAYPISTASTFEELVNGEVECFVIAQGKTLVGELWATSKMANPDQSIDGKRVYLFAYRVKSEEQGKGLGKRLLNETITYYKKRGYTEFTIGVEDDNARAKHIYEVMGFTEFVCRCCGEYEGSPFECDLLLRKDEA